MRASTALKRSQRIAVRLLAAVALLLGCSSAAHAVCVGDCRGDGEVRIEDLILGVNIALGLADISTCPSFDCENNGMVPINCLIQGVDNSLNGCPDEPTATATNTSPPSTATATVTHTAAATATNTSEPTTTHTGTATATDTPEPPPTETATSTPPDTETATTTPTGTPVGTATATATGTPTGTATATVTPTGTPAGTATATATETETETPTPEDTPTATEPPLPSATPTDTETPQPTETSTDTPTEGPTPTPTETATEADTATSTPTATETDTPTETPTATETQSPTATQTEVPIGEDVGGRAALVASGLNNINAVIGGIVAQAANPGPLELNVGVDEVQVTDINSCPVSGTTEDTCTEMGTLAQKTIKLVLEATHCKVMSPVGGTAEFDGKITVDSTPFILNDCDPLLFVAGTYTVGDPMVPEPFSILFRNDMMEQTLAVSADLTGSVSIQDDDPACLIGKLTVTLNGSITSQLTDGTSLRVEFDGTSMVMDMIDYNADCVPLSYRLEFDGDAQFNIQLAPPGAATNGGGINDFFEVVFSDFFLTQDGDPLPATVTMSGSMESECFGGAVGVNESLPLPPPLIVLPGQVCPDSGQLNVTAGSATATVVYDDGMVTVTQGGVMQNYGSCLAPDLIMCIH